MRLLSWYVLSEVTFSSMLQQWSIENWKSGKPDKSEDSFYCCRPFERVPACISNSSVSVWTKCTTIKRIDTIREKFPKQ